PFVVAEPEAVELVKRGHVTKVIVSLVRDLLLPDQFLLPPRQFFIAQSFGRELPDFVEQRRLLRLDLLRIGPKIKQEQSPHESLHLARADKIGQAHFYADAHKKTRTEIAARPADQLQRR